MGISGSVLADALGSFGQGFLARKDKMRDDALRDEDIRGRRALSERSMALQESQLARMLEQLELQKGEADQRRQERERAASAAAALRTRRIQALVGRGLSPEEADALADDEVAFRDVMKPKEAKAPPQTRIQNFGGKAGRVDDSGNFLGYVTDPAGKELPYGDPERAPQGSFVPLVDTATGEATFYNPTTGATREAPTGLARSLGPGGTERFKRQQAVANVEDALNRFEKTIDVIGPTFMPGVDKATLETDYENVQLQLKELYNLGVLNGPDLLLMRRVLSNPTDVSTRFSKGLGSADRHKAAIKAQIQRVREQLESTKRNLETAPVAGTAPRSDGTDMELLLQRFLRKQDE